MQPWYKKGWGVALIGLGALIVVIVLVFGAFVLRYWRQIKYGQGDALYKTFYENFTRSAGQSTAAPADRARIESGDDPSLGNPKGEVIIVEFVDFLCPNCKAADPILKEVIKQYGYKVKLIQRDFPAESIHPGATQFAQFASCAHDQGKYWQVHDHFLTYQDAMAVPLSAEAMSALSLAYGLDDAKLKTCMDTNRTVVEINKDYADGFYFGVRGTPTFFVNGQKIEGVIPFSVWETIIKAQ